ncbi:major tail protein [Vibrio phage 1.242.O._10N.261.54.B2]|nr:major tail protein [Vibrio phage 1.242.O._10N.261.54.B2]
MACNQPASANATRVFYCIQDECGVLPENPVFKQLRYTGGVPNLTMDELTSSELDGTAEITNIRLGSRQVANEAGVELYFGAHDELLSAVMQSDWVAGTTLTAQAVEIDATAKEVKVVGDITASISAGDFFVMPGLTLGGNMKPLQATTVAFNATDTVIGIDTAKDLSNINPDGVADEVGVSDFTTSDKLLVGNARQQLALLVEYGDINGGPTYDLVMDAEVGAFTFNVAVNAIVTGTFSMMGKSLQQNSGLPAGATLVEGNDEKPFTGIDGAMSKNGIPLVLSASADMNLDRSATASFEIGSKYMSHVSYGKAVNSVSVSTFFYDYALSGDYENEIEGEYTIALSLDSKLMAFQYPTAIITGLERDVTEGDITQSVTLSPYKPIDKDSSLIIHRIEG